MFEFTQALIAIFFGFLLGLGGDWIKGLLKNKKTSKSIKTLINLESEKNKFLLKEFWGVISKSESYWFVENNEFEYGKLANAINDVPFPHISTVAWEKNFNSIPIYYKSHQLKNLWKIYENIDLLIQIKEHLSFNENEAVKMGSKIENRARVGKNIIGEIIRSYHFNKDSPDLAKKFKETIERIIGDDAIQFINRN